MDIKKIIITVSILQFISTFSQSRCVSFTIEKLKGDSVRIKFKNSCTKEFLFYRYNENSDISINETYNLDDINLITKKKYKISKISKGLSDQKLYSFEQVKNNVFSLKKNAVYELSIPINVFIKRDTVRYKHLNFYYLISPNYDKNVVKFRVKYEPKFIKENINNFEDHNFYDTSLISNYIETVLR